MLGTREGSGKRSSRARSTRLKRLRQDKTRQDIYYQNITCTISWHAVSRKTPVVACQINSNAKLVHQHRAPYIAHAPAMQVTTAVVIIKFDLGVGQFKNELSDAREVLQKAKH